MNCKYLSKKLNGKLYCKKKKEYIENKCINCDLREFNEKRYNWTTTPKNSSYQSKNKGNTMRQRSSKLAKLEKNRKSIFTDNLEKCYFCPRKKDHIHEIIHGANRLNSIRYNFTLPLCSECHRNMHNNEPLQNEYQDKCQLYFEKHIGSKEEFISIFKMDYIETHKLEQKKRDRN